MPTAEPDERADAERVAVIREMREARKAARVAIVRALTDFPIPDGAGSKREAWRRAHHRAAGNPDDARDFARRLQTIIRNDDGPAFAALLDSAWRGPDPGTIRKRGIRDTLGKAWAGRVASDDPPCAPVGWRGFMLGRGALWFRENPEGWRVTAVNPLRTGRYRPETPRMSHRLRERPGRARSGRPVRAGSHDDDGIHTKYDIFATDKIGGRRHQPAGSGASRIAVLTPVTIEA